MTTDELQFEVETLKDAEIALDLLDSWERLYDDPEYHHMRQEVARVRNRLERGSVGAVTLTVEVEE